MAGETVDVGVPVLGGGERADVAAGAEVRAVADEQDRADRLVERAQGVADDGQRLVVQRAVAAPRDPAAQDPALVAHGIAHRTPSLRSVGFAGHCLEGALASSRAGRRCCVDDSLASSLMG